MLKQLLINIYWVIVALVVLFILIMISLDLWKRNNAGFNRIVPQVEAYGRITNYFKEVGQW